MAPNNQHMIFWRIEQDDVASVEIILDAHVDVDVRGFLGMTSAICAAGANNWRTVELSAARASTHQLKHGIA